VNAKTPGGVYVHFPFCRHRCFYCDFNLITPKLIPERRYTDALLSELQMRAPHHGPPARSLYFGGGTPSLWNEAMLGEVIAAVRGAIGLESGAEVTLEANPSDITGPRCKSWLKVGINRLSIGLQSFDSRILRDIDRQHDGDASIQAIRLAKSSGFSDLSIDLMFGLPGQNEAAWRQELETALEFDVPHISIYGLTVEERTPLRRLVGEGAVVLPSDDTSAAMFFAAHDTLEAAGYSHYEVSAYARGGAQAVHNSGYWNWRPYLGLGAGAHGFDGETRRENIRRVKTYMDHAVQGKLPTGKEERPPQDALAFEKLMVGLRRLKAGVELHGLLERFGPKAEELIGRGWLEKEGAAIRVTREGLRWMNEVLAEFV